ncbi:flp pilus assembly protein CpaB [Fictibacillus phosphorivorans]|uniref:Flp pilus assembly protein CpaB n=1 Tax=Fictibacillus phosphorivorans TaxID=1221500 RepID=A0A163RPT7_9BACL|nr:flagella basal body P-ring formation protein FlgA [Fictibacillus phosphorivorans]KZE67337.1 flp pilus assembly protein CpaB [Fictibacillus phosphorivorans]
MLESKRKAIIFITLSVLLAILAGVMFLQKVKALNNQLGDTTPVYVAKTEIPSRELIKPSQVKTIEIPNKYITNKHIIDKNKLANRVSIIPLSPDDVITTNMLKEASTVRDQNNRLVTVMSSEKVSFDQLLEASDRVDIIISHKFDDKPKTELFMSDVLVSSVGTKNGNFKGVALEVSAEDAPKLIHMQNYADSVRILKANVGRSESNNEQKKSEESKTETPAPKAPEKTPPAEPKPAAKPAPAPAPKKE